MGATRPTGVGVFTARVVTVVAAMLDEALTVIRRLWTEESVSFAGRFFTLDDARCEPKAVQRPHPPIVIGGSQPKMLRVIARHANEWNCTGSPDEWAKINARLDEACDEVLRDPTEIRRSLQLFLHPAEERQIDEQLACLPQIENLGCDHVVLSFYQPPSIKLLERCANLY